MVCSYYDCCISSHFLSVSVRSVTHRRNQLGKLISISKAGWDMGCGSHCLFFISLLSCYCYLCYFSLSFTSGSCTYIGILALCLAGITSCGCCLFPLCMTSCKDIVHSCPNCQEEVGVYSRARARTIPV